MPKASVIIPTYNSVKYLPEAIDSILNQTYKDFEIIVIDDGSTDKTKDIVDTFIKEYRNKIRYFYQQNKGPGAARNRGIEMATGEYIAFLDSDDLWLPEKLEKSLNFLNSYGFDWICTASYKLNSDNKKSIRYVNNAFLDSSEKRLNILKNGLFFFSHLHIEVAGVLTRKHCFKKAGLFDENFIIGEDVDLWFRFEEAKLSGGYLNEPLYIYRLNKDSITKTKKITGLQENIRLAKKHALLLGMDNRVIRRTYSEFLWRYSDLLFGYRRYFESLICLFKSLILYPEFNKLIKIINFLTKIEI